MPRIINFIKKIKRKVAAEQVVSSAIETFRERPLSWDAQLMGNEQEVEEKILSRLLDSLNENKKNNSVRIIRLALASAAAVLIAAITCGCLFWNEIADHLVSYPQLIVEAKAGEQTKITLPDGSMVILNSGTKLSYPAQFNHQRRDVVLLEGEAYFDIQHDSRRPFVVKADGTETRVLGTAFNIRAYRFMPTVTVIVSRGKVLVHHSSVRGVGSSCYLHPNQQIIYSKNTGLLKKSEVNARQAMGWMEGKLSFAGESFGQVAELLKNKYDVFIRFEDEDIESYHFSASFEPSESLTDVLNALTLTKGLFYTVKNNIVTISHAKDVIIHTKKRNRMK